MKTLVTRWSRTRHFNFPTAFVVLAFAVAALALPLYSVNSSSLGVKAPGVDAEGKAPVSANSKFWFPSFAPVAGETVELFAADCATPKTDFNVGEIVCAKTNGVDLSVANNHYMNWIDSQLNSTNGGTITQNPQLFLFAAPTAGTWKATIGRVSPADSSIIGNPPLFTVSEGLAVATFASNCTTPKTAFVLGETVCVKVSGLAVNASFPNRIAWTDPAGVVRSRTDITADPQSDTFPLGNTVDNRGTWQANITRNNGRRITSAPFTVSDPQQAVADVYVQKFNRDPDQAISSGGSAVFILVVGNSGPDAAQSVALADSFPAGLTLASFTQQSGPACLPASTGNCTMGTLKSGERAEFTAIYNTGTVGAGLYSTSATVSSSTADSNNNNNSSTAEFEIAAGGGGSQCTLTCPTSPAPVNNAPGQNGATVDWNGPNNDNIPVATGTGCGAVSVSTTSPRFFSIGTTPITVTTESGEECTFSVTVNDVEDPVIANCPANIIVPENPGTPGEAVVNYPTPSATDNNGSASVTCDRPSGNTFTVAGSPHTVTCTATDDAGNSDSCTFTVRVNAPTTCVITHADVSVDSAANACGATVPYADPTADSNCATGTTFTCNRPSGSFFPVGDTTVTCTKSPDNATVSFTVTVRDVTGPVPNVPTLAMVTGECSATAGVPTVVDPPGPPPPFIVFEPPTATDACDGQIAASTSDQRTYDEPGEHTVTWHYTDAAGNDVTQPQIVKVTGPTGGLDISGAAVVGVHNSAGSTSCVMVIDDLTSILNTSVSGTCGAPEITRTISPAPGDGNDFTVGTLYTVVSTVTEGNSTDSVTQTFKIIDDTPPVVVSVPANATYQCLSEVPAGNASDATATDNCVNPTVSVADTNNGGAGSPSSPLIITRTFTATDVTSGLTHSKAQTITVIDNTPPTIALNQASENPQYVECHTSYPELGATASDNCATATFAATPSGTVDVNTPGTYTITYNATDAAGNSATPVKRTVIVQDTIKPVITRNGPGIVQVECHTSYTDAGASASDSCDTNVPVTTNGSVDVNVVGDYTLTYTAADDSGNQADQVTRVVQVRDTTAPTITCPDSITLEPTCPSGAVATYALPTATDSCSATVTIIRTAGPASGSVFPIGTTTVTYSATDASGNSSSCSFTVTVKTALAVVEDLKLRVAALQPPLTGQQVQGLQSKLEAARLAIIAVQTNVACNKLADFISQVQAYINNGKLTSAQGQPLINSAAKVRNTLGCTNNPCS